MTENSPPPPPSPFALNPARITILLLGALAIFMIVGAILGGVSNYQELKEARDATLSSSEPSSSP